MKRRGRVEIEFEGLNASRVIERLRTEKVAVIRFSKRGKSCRIVGEIADKAQIVAILTESLYNIKNIRELSLGATVKKYNAYFVGVALFLLVVCFFNCFIYAPYFEGEDAGDVLSEGGYVFPVLKTEELANEVSETLKASGRFALVEVDIIGNTLYIATEPKLTENKQTGEARSSYDGVITKQIILSGSATKSVGDKVREGEELISPILKSDKTGLSARVTPRGIVYGVTTVTKSCQIAKNEVSFIEKESWSSRHIELFGLTLFEKEYDLSPIYERKSVVMDASPIFIVERRYSKSEMTERAVDVNEELRFQTKVFENEIAEEHLGDRVLSEKIDVTDYGSYVLLNITYEIEKIFYRGGNG